MKKRKIPMRKCVVTHEMKPKKELIRVVRNQEGIVSIDPTGKMAGRGAYLTKSEEVILLAKQKKSLNEHLKAQVDDVIYDELLFFIQKEK